ncbi:nitrogenase iron-molybdenum cofactor biosynthesis protein NifN [Thermochromatium tepidum]|uniref:Nitrogenase iron-molybdenum cofactor biosynthesis protein NifN n=1 Tax=Thermochromatium tepidum ATCC 43061 TaxID=316276 RepID=A0A6I6EG58_THETI|nr:nitrogenase iron-molybdenum cofactor biosynthesis protein NifN [Thermochromatium tepidum]QGU33190.1 nitrogenase iron-molybdenum cofactor biosynthesis protein NifN [Thermochromatium tepidum ATCC 43061]
MAQILPRCQPLTANPLKVPSSLGASLAFLGLSEAIPMLHGAQGCTAFSKVFLVRHFREPIPLQTTAMDQIATIMGADDNLIEGLATLCAKAKPKVIGLPTTALAETQGADVHRVIKEFRTRFPEYDSVAIVPVATPDFSGGLESGFAAAVEAIIEHLVPSQGRPGQRPHQVNVLVSSMHTPGDIEWIKEWIESFGLHPLVLPDLGDSLDGHLIEAETTPLTLGGTPRCALETLGESLATLVIGRSLGRAADRLKDRTGVPDLRFDHLLGLEACDAFTQALAELSGRPVPDRIERQRAQLQDAMVDTHFMTGFARVGLALEPDQLLAFCEFLISVGSEIVAAVAPTRAESLLEAPCQRVQIGDLADLERIARLEQAQILIGSSHLAPSAERLGVPLLRAGFPQYDLVGGYARPWIGYRGARQALFDFANLILNAHHEITPYRSIYRQDDAQAELGVA